MKKFTFLLLCLIGLPLLSLAQTITRLDKSTITAAALDAKIQSLMLAAKVSGLAVAVFNQNKPVYQKTFGYKNAVTKEPLGLATNMYGASLSKAVFAVLVMQLVQEGKLDLDKPLQSYLPQPIYAYPPQTKWQDHYQDLKEDSLYKTITARMCLSHTTGLPNWRWDNPDEKLRIQQTPGTKYGYSGEGLVFLQTVLEKMMGMPLEKMMQQRIFGPLGMKTSSYTWQPAFEKDFAFGHKTTGELYEKDKDNEARSASTLETTLPDYVRFTTAVLQHTLLKPATTKAMFSPQIKLTSVQQFGPQRHKQTTANEGIQLSYGLGWVLLKSPYGTGAFKEGHGDGFQHYSILFPETGTGIVLLANSDNAEGIFKELLEFALKDTYTPWYWENYIPYNQEQK